MSRRSRRWTPTTSTRSPSTTATGARGSRSGCSRSPRTEATRHGCARLALDTGLQNRPARALYDAYGFREREIRRAPSDRIAKALGGPGFVGYLKDLR